MYLYYVIDLHAQVIRVLACARARVCNETVWWGAVVITHILQRLKLLLHIQSLVLKIYISSFLSMLLMLSVAEIIYE